MNTDELPAGEPSGPQRLGAHGFDPISAIFGLLACLAGALVITGTVDPAGEKDAVVWIAAAVIAVGLAILPWGSRGRRNPN